MKITYADMNVMYDIIRNAEDEIQRRLDKRVRLNMVDMENVDLSPEAFATTIAEALGYSFADLAGTSRKTGLVYTRFIVCHLFLKRYPAPMSLTAIGELMNRDHTTMMHARDETKNKLEVQDEQFVKQYTIAINAIEKWLERI